MPHAYETPTPVPSLLSLAEAALDVAYRLRGEYLLSELGDLSVPIPTPMDHNGDFVGAKNTRGVCFPSL